LPSRERRTWRSCARATLLPKRHRLGLHLRTHRWRRPVGGRRLPPDAPMNLGSWQHGAARGVYEARALSWTRNALTSVAHRNLHPKLSGQPPMACNLRQAPDVGCLASRQRRSHQSRKDSPYVSSPSCFMSHMDRSSVLPCMLEGGCERGESDG